ncbi:MAG: tape measure protein, partial [Cyanobacteria bacterium J06633_2]
DDAIAGLDPLERTGTREGNQLANLKKQVLDIQGSFDEISAAMQQFSSSDVPELVQGEAPQLKTLTGYRKEIEALGKQFFGQLKTAQALMQSGETEEAQAIAKEMLVLKDEYRDVLSQFKTGLTVEGTTPPSVTKAVSTARGRITKGLKGAEEIIQETEALGVNTGTAFNSGLENTLSEAQQSASELGLASIDALKDVLGIQSPSKVGIWIGEMLGKGLEMGVRKGIEDMTVLVNDGILPLFASVGKMTQGAALQASVDKAIARAKELQQEIDAIDTENNAIVIGGFAGQQGQSSKPVSDAIGTMLGDSFSVDAIANVASDTSTDFSNKARFVWDIIAKALVMEIAKGFNPDAIEAAAMAIARKNQTGVDSDFIGYSAGGYVAREAQQIAQSAGVDSRAAGFGTPMFGMFGTDSSRFRSYMGNTDVLAPLASRFGGRREASLKFGDYGDRHLLSNYLSSSDIQSDLSGFLGKSLPGFGIDDPAAFAKGNIEPFGKAIGDGMANALEDAESTADKAAMALADSIIEATEEALGIESPSKVFHRIGEYIGDGLIDGIKSRAKSAVSATQSFINTATESAREASQDQSARGFQPFNVSTKRPDVNIPIPVIGEFAEEAASFLLDSLDNMKEMATFAPRLGRAIGSVSEGLIKNRGLLIDLVKGFAGIKFVLLPTLEFLNGFSEQAFQVAAEIESIERTISFTSGGVNAGAENIAFARQVARDTNTNVQQGLSGFAGLSASARGTELEGESIRQAFSALTEASAAYSIDAQTQERAFTAVTQVIDKQVVSMEEIRGQLSEALPGAMAIAARSMNMGTREFQALVSSGELLAEDFIPRFAQQLSAESGIGLAGASDTAQAAINRLNNATTESLELFGKNIAPAKKLGINALAAGLDFANENMETLIRVGLAVAGVIYGKTIASIVQLGIASIKSAVGVNVLSGSTTLLAKGIGRMLPMLKQMALTFGLITAATDTFTIVSTAFGDNSQGIRDFADQSIDALERYLEVVEKINSTELEGNQGNLGIGDRAQNYLREMSTGRSMLEDTFLGSIAPKEAIRFYERGYQNLLDMIPGTGRLGSTYEDLIASQMNVALGDLTTTSGQLEGDILTNYLGASGEGIGALAEVAELDKRLDELRSERRSLAPGD